MISTVARMRFIGAPVRKAVRVSSNRGMADHPHRLGVHSHVSGDRRASLSDLPVLLTMVYPSPRVATATVSKAMPSKTALRSLRQVDRADRLNALPELEARNADPNERTADAQKADDDVADRDDRAENVHQGAHPRGESSDRGGMRRMWPHASRVAIFGHHHSGIVGLTTCEINHLSESPLPPRRGARVSLVSRQVTTTDRWPCRGASASHTASLHARQMPQHDSGLVPPGRLWVHDGETCMDVPERKG